MMTEPILFIALANQAAAATLLPALLWQAWLHALRDPASRRREEPQLDEGHGLQPPARRRRRPFKGRMTLNAAQAQPASLSIAARGVAA